MSLISRGVLALVNHWGFLAGAGNMQSSPSSLLDLSHHALIRHSSKLYRDSWFSRVGLAQKCIHSSAGHLWMSFKGFEKWKKCRPCLAQYYLTGLHVFSSPPLPPLIEKPWNCFLFLQGGGGEPLFSSLQSSGPLGRVKVAPQQWCEVRREGVENQIAG